MAKSWEEGCMAMDEVAVVRCIIALRGVGEEEDRQVEEE